MCFWKRFETWTLNRLRMFITDYWDFFPIGPVWPIPTKSEPSQPKTNVSAAPLLFLMRTL